MVPGEGVVVHTIDCEELERAQANMTDWLDVKWRTRAFLNQCRALAIPMDTSSSVLEIGCGLGVLRQMLEKVTAWNVDAIDLNAGALFQSAPGRGRTALYNIHDRAGGIAGGEFFSGALTDYAVSSGDRRGYTGFLDDKTANGAIHLRPDSLRQSPCASSRIDIVALPNMISPRRSLPCCLSIRCPPLISPLMRRLF